MKQKNIKTMSFILLGFVILIAGFSFCSFIANRKNLKFIKNELSNAATNYILKNNIAIDNELEVPIELLKKQGFLDNNISCSNNSYIIVKNVDGEYEYSLMIDCNNSSTTVTNNITYMNSNKLKSSVVETILTYDVEKSITTKTNGNVQVKIIASEPILEVDGWVRINNNTTLVKVFDENVFNENVTLISMDNSNKYETVSITVDNIDRVKPVVTGVVHNTVYNHEVMIHFFKQDAVLTAKLNGIEIDNDYVVSQDGNYNLVVNDDIGNATTVNFKIDRRIPNVDGVENGGYYNYDVTISFDKGTATLNGMEFNKGETVSLEGNYILIVTDSAGNKNEINFTIDKTKPVVTNIIYNSNENHNRFNSDVLVKITYNEPIKSLVDSWNVSSDNSNQIYKYFSGEENVDTIINDIAIVHDLAGNQSDFTNINFVIDKIIPTGIIDATPQTYTNGTVTLLLETSEDVIINNPLSDNVYQYELGNNRKFAVERSQNGLFIFNFKDLAGNISGVSYNVQNIDNKKPVITDISYSDGLINGVSKENIIVEVTYNEAVIPLQTGWSNVIGYDNKIFKEFKCLENVEINIDENIIVEDFAKNQSDPENIKFIIDKKIPIGEVNADVTSLTTGNVILTLTTDEDVIILNDDIEGIKQIDSTDARKYFVTITENTEFTFKFQDLIGNIGSASYEVNNIDRDAPTIQEIKYSSELIDGRAKNDVIVTIIYDENVVSLDDEWQNVPGKTNELFKLFTGADNADTLIHEFVTVKDLVGNVSAPKNINFVIDKTIPTVDYIINNSSTNGWYNKPIEVTIIGQDATLGISKYEYCLIIDGVSQEWQEILDVDNASFTIDVNSSNVSFAVRSFDKVGNVSLEKQSEIYKIDTNAPNLIYDVQNVLDANGWNNSELSILINVTDNLSGVALLQYSYSTNNGISWTEWNNLDIINSYSNLVINEESNTLLIKLRASDYANNIKEYAIDNNYKIDKTKPIITVYDGEKENTTDFTVYVEANKNGSYNFPKATVKDNLDNEIKLNIYGNPDLTKVGIYNVVYSATDHANNTTVLTMTVVVHDTNAPVIKLLGDNPLNLEYGQAYIEYGVTIEDNLDDNLVVVIGGDVVNPKEIGTYTITYSATDNSGNSSTVTRLVNVASTNASIVIKDSNECEDNQDCYITNELNNYVWYSGFLWRIIKVNEDNTIKLITEDSVSGFSYDDDSSDFSASIVNDWLNNNFYEALNNNSIIINSNYCMDQLLPTKEYSNESGMNVQTSDYAKANVRYNCNNSYQTKVSLLTIDEYNILGAENSYLNTKDHFFTMTPSTDKTVWIIQTDGVEKAWNTVTNTYAIRPVITISSSIKITNGSGTIEKPYQFENDESAKANSLLLNRYSGEYVKFGNQLWRIVSTNSLSTKLIMDSYYQLDDDYVKLKYGNTGDYKNSEVIKYLNDTVYNNLFTDYEKKVIVSANWEYGSYVKGQVPLKYAKDNISNVEAYVGLISIGELMSGTSSTGRVDGFTSWTMNYFENFTNPIGSYAWFISWGGTSSLAFNRTDIRGLRPVINLNIGVSISSGAGTINDPYILNY